MAMIEVRLELFIYGADDPGVDYSRVEVARELADRLADSLFGKAPKLFRIASHLSACHQEHADKH